MQTLTPSVSSRRTQRQKGNEDRAGLDSTVSPWTQQHVWPTPSSSRTPLLSSSHTTAAKRPHPGPLNTFKIIETTHVCSQMELNQKSVTREFQNIWRLNTTLLNNTWIKKEISIEIGKHFELNNNENTTYQNLWDVAKAEL